jgi:hypothetical protein
MRLKERRSEIQGQIDGYRGTPGYINNEIHQLQLETALLKRDIINIQITLTDKCAAYIQRGAFSQSLLESQEREREREREREGQREREGWKKKAR